ncbi:hypothetical protein BGZ83_001625 [Gryganskiella cystojenkinii]|nr:hypothetical protein BGZ83_001625 [Gryganskiella cystojenkinii]
MIRAVWVPDLTPPHGTDPLLFDQVARACSRLEKLSLGIPTRCTRLWYKLHIDFREQKQLIGKLLAPLLSSNCQRADDADHNSRPVYQLRTLVLHGPCFEPPNTTHPVNKHIWNPMEHDPFPTVEQCQISWTLAKLQHLTIIGATVWEARQFDLFCKYFPPLAQLALLIWEPEFITSQQRDIITKSATMTSASPVLSMPSSSPSSLARQQLNITSLRLEGMRTLSSKAIFRLTQGLPNLEELSLRFPPRKRMRCLIFTPDHVFPTPSSSSTSSSGSQSLLPLCHGLKRFSLESADVQSLRLILPHLVNVDDFCFTSIGDILNRESDLILEAFADPLIRNRDRPFRKLELNHRVHQFQNSYRFMKNASLSKMLHGFQCFSQLETLVLGMPLDKFMFVCKPSKIPASRGRKKKSAAAGVSATDGSGHDEEEGPMYRFPSWFESLRVLKLQHPEGRWRDMQYGGHQEAFWSEYLPRMPRLQKLTIWDVHQLELFPFRYMTVDSKSGSVIKKEFFQKIKEGVNGRSCCACAIHLGQQQQQQQTEKKEEEEQEEEEEEEEEWEQSSLPSPILPPLPLPVPKLTHLNLRVYGELRNRRVRSRWWSGSFFTWVESHFPDLEGLHLRGYHFSVEERTAARVDALARWPDIEFCLEDLQ